jgi:hypothetical protein
MAERWELDLIGFLNGAAPDELHAWCLALEVRSGTPGIMRQRLWAWGAAHERRMLGLEPDGAVQPSVVVERGLLRVARARARRAGPGTLPAARAAKSPPSATWPRPVPPTRSMPPSTPAEPAALAELLTRANDLIGVRLGVRGRDKGAYGQRVAELLGLPRSSEAAPDWRGEVEVKTLAVVRARGGLWSLKDTPALAMRAVDARSKLRRVLWIVRIDEGEVPGAPILSWFYQELEPTMERAFEAARHLRPKGAKGTSQRGWYLRREFFELCGLMRSLNGG